MSQKSKLQTKLDNNDFVITAEVFPPKGTDISNLLKKVEIIKDCVDAINVTDCQRSILRISSLAISAKLVELGVEPVMQLTCRDRNRLALQSDLLGASFLGIKNILLMSGDYPTIGDHKDSKPVYDLDSTQLIFTANNLNKGFDLANKELKGKTDLFIGGTLNPNSTPYELPIMAMNKKIEAGAKFFQTQPVFDLESYKEFSSKLNTDTKIIIGVFLLKSYDFAKRISTIPGINIPDSFLKRLKDSKDELQEGINIAVELINELKSQVQGIHIMAIGVEEHIPEIIRKVKLK